MIKPPSCLVSHAFHVSLLNYPREIGLSDILLPIGLSDILLPIGLLDISVALSVGLLKSRVNTFCIKGGLMESLALETADLLIMVTPTPSNRKFCPLPMVAFKVPLTSYE